MRATTRDNREETAPPALDGTQAAHARTGFRALTAKIATAAHAGKVRAR